MTTTTPILRETTTPAVAPAVATRRTPFALRLFADHGWAVRIWFCLALLSLAAALIQPFLIVSAYRTKERVVVLDEAGTFHLSPLLDFEDATKLHTSQTLLACLALFQKNPHGFDYPELLDRIFLPAAREKAKSLDDAQRVEFKGKQIHQKVEVFRIDILQTRNDSVLVEATGQLLRVGIFNGEPFTESPPFKVRFTLARNPNLTRNGRFPLAVWQFDIP